MTTVVDLGPVDWGRIWGDRAGLVSPEHLTELNAISPGTHSMSPGYWRNLFASYPEIISKAGYISQFYVRPGQTPKYYGTTQDKPMTKVTAMNTFVANTVEKNKKEAEAIHDNAPHPIVQGFIIIGRETGITKAAEKVGGIVENLGSTVSNVADGVKNVSNNFKNASEHSTEIIQGLMIGGLALVGAYVYSAVK